MAERAANEGFRMLEDFVCDAISALAIPPAAGTRHGRNEGMRVVEECVLDLGAVPRLVNELQATIDELKRQNAALKASLMDTTRLVQRYYLDGPAEDDI